MKIITVSLEELQLKEVDSLVGEKKMFPSRSELARVAIREFLLKRLAPITKENAENDLPIAREIIASDTTIQIRVNNTPESDGSFSYKTYRIIKK